MAYAAGGSVDEHGLTRGKPGDIEQRLPSYQRHERKGCRLDEVQRLWYGRECRRIRSHILRVRAAPDAEEAIYCIARLEISDSVPDCLDHAGHVHSQDQREHILEHFFHVAYANFPVYGIDSRCFDLYQGLPYTGLRLRHVLAFKTSGPPKE